MFRINLHPENPRIPKFIGLARKGNVVQTLFAQQFNDRAKLTTGFFFVEKPDPLKEKPETGSLKNTLANNKKDFDLEANDEKKIILRENIIALINLIHCAQGYIFTRVDFEINDKTGDITFRDKTLVAKEIDPGNGLSIHVSECEITGLHIQAGEVAKQEARTPPASSLRPTQSFERVVPKPPLTLAEKLAVQPPRGLAPAVAFPRPTIAPPSASPSTTPVNPNLPLQQEGSRDLQAERGARIGAMRNKIAAARPKPQPGGGSGRRRRPLSPGSGGSGSSVY